MSLFLLVATVLLVLIFIAWRRYLWAANKDSPEHTDRCPYSLTEGFGENHLVNVPHQEGVQWLTDIFSRSAERYPDLTALQVPHTGESLTFAELDTRAIDIAVALSPYLTGPDQVVAIAMSQDNWQIVAAHLGVLKAGGTLMFLDTSLPDALVAHMLEDAEPAVVLTRGEATFRDLPALDVLALPRATTPLAAPSWLDDPGERLAAIFYTSGTTGMPKGVECPHAGYVNLALSYADYFDLVPGMDATSLTSSLGYDGSISEMYSAWVAGCAVVLLTREQVRAGPDLVSVLCEAEVTMLFCPPVLLSTLTSQPEVDLPYPICRYIVPAGEAFPGALVEPWTRARRQIINTYGPTEASTDTSRQSLRPNEPVTIGSPLANVRYVVLEVGGDRPLRHGETGELCIGGVHVARGYRNLPEQTAEKFITHPQFGRLYRTGDICRIDIRKQRAHFLGRADTQLKVRGHRVETQAVEDILQAQFSEIESAVLDYQEQELVAFVMAPSLVEGDIAEVAAAPAEWVENVMAVLREQLAEPSLPSRIFLVERFAMKPTSGKIDRDRLPQLSQALTNVVPGRAQRSMEHTIEHVQSPGVTQPTDPDLEAVLAVCREVLGDSLGLDHGFAESGGHSIAIAQLAQRLQVAGWPVPVRELLGDCGTARKVVARSRIPESHSAVTAPAACSDEDAHGRDERAARVISVGLFTFLQLLFLVLLFSPQVLGLVAAVAYLDIGEFFLAASLWQFIRAGFLLYLLALCVPFAILVWVMLIKLCMGGHVYRNNVTPGTYPKWSRMHLRTWCIERMERSVLMPMGALLRSAPLTAYALRRLGATVGDNLHCADSVNFSGPLSLLSIGDDVTIQTGAYVHLTRWSGQELDVGPIHLESRCKIGMRAAVSPGVTIGHGSQVRPLAPIVNDVGPGEMWDGAPAQFSGRCTDLNRSAVACRTALPRFAMEALNILMQVCLDFLLLVAPSIAIAWFARYSTLIGDQGTSAGSFEAAPLVDIAWDAGVYAFVTSWAAFIVVSVLVCLFIRLTAVSPGVYPSPGLKAALLMYRVKKMNQLQRRWTWTITGQYLRALSGMRFTHTGASECDLMTNLVPELASADACVFWSNGCFTNMLDYDARHITLRQLDMPLNFFAGSNSVAESGQFPSNFLLGVSTPGDDVRFRRQMRWRPGQSITVAGNPPVSFASADFEAENAAHREPGFLMFLSRVVLNDIVGIGILRIAVVPVYVLLFIMLSRFGGSVLVSAFLALVFAEATLVLLCILIKTLIVGSWGYANTTPFWSWRHFSYFFAQDCFFAWCRGPLGFLAGTLLSNAILRRLGCRIGRRTIIAEPMQASDWNAVSFGDDCVIAGVLQFHTFENMTLKVKRTEIRGGSTVNFGATVMGGAVIESGTNLLPLSLVLKEIHLTPATYHGSPSEIDVSQS